MLAITMETVIEGTKARTMQITITVIERGWTVMLLEEQLAALLSLSF